MSTDPYGLVPSTLEMPAINAANISPSDSQGLTFTTRGIYVGGAGDLAVICVGDSSAVTFKSVAAGSILPLRVKQVMNTNTTATSIIALY